MEMFWSKISFLLNHINSDWICNLIGMRPCQWPHHGLHHWWWSLHSNEQETIKIFLAQIRFFSKTCIQMGFVTWLGCNWASNEAVSKASSWHPSSMMISSLPSLNKKQRKCNDPKKVFFSIRSTQIGFVTWSKWTWASNEAAPMASSWPLSSMKLSLPWTRNKGNVLTRNKVFFNYLRLNSDGILNLIGMELSI